ncbi:hypothetical protein AM588_10002963 [Phytophthora nicotianae]|uniref:Choline transporter-like protein n=1 Tax=Phytophthora nicotianae TaxID=4792 RepID=A0A0W8D450_PHYNI|nr:hypothetical protein AM588_10002963 [Phytophthora nicotianae]
MELDRADEEVLLEKVPQQLPAGQRDERKDYFFAVTFAANCASVLFIAVAKNVVHCITAGAVGEWWFGAQDVNTIQRAQTRALTTSLGSICVGSLVVAVLNALHTLLLSAPRRKAKGSANAFLEFLVKLVMRNMQYFNKYAFCQVALYGKDFRLAGTDTMHLFRDRGWTALLNDSLISSVLSVGCLVVGTICLFCKCG